MKRINVFSALVAVMITGFAFSQDSQDFELFKRVQSIVAEKGDLGFLERDNNLIEEYLTQLCATNAIIFSGDTNRIVGAGSPNPFSLAARLANAKDEGSERDEEYARWDDAFVSSGMAYSPWSGGNISTKFDKCCRRFVMRLGGEEKFPVTFAMFDRYPAKAKSEYGVSDKINALCEAIARGIISVQSISVNVKGILRDAQIPVKRYIRMSGKSFVVGDDGKNPVQDIIDELVSAFESPRLEGVKEWVAEIVPEYEWVDVVPAFSADETELLRDKVFYGEEPLSSYNATCLRYGLGLDGYNEFIKRYNGQND